MPKRIYNRAYACVRFKADNLDPLIVTHALRIPPDCVHRDGEPRLVRLRSGKIEERSPYRGGLWSMSSRNWVQSPRLAIHLDWLLSELEPKAIAVRALLDDGIDADFFCFSSGLIAAPPSLPRAIRDRAAALGIEIVIDHYGPPASGGTTA